MHELVCKNLISHRNVVIQGYDLTIRPVAAINTVQHKLVVSCNIVHTILTHVRPNSNWNLLAAIYLATCCGLRNTAVAFTLEPFI